MKKQEILKSIKVFKFTNKKNIYEVTNRLSYFNDFILCAKCELFPLKRILFLSIN